MGREQRWLRETVVAAHYCVMAEEMACVCVCVWDWGWGEQIRGRREKEDSRSQHRDFSSASLSSMYSCDSRTELLVCYYFPYHGQNYNDCPHYTGHPKSRRHRCLDRLAGYGWNSCVCGCIMWTGTVWNQHVKLCDTRLPCGELCKHLWINISIPYNQAQGFESENSGGSPEIIHFSLKKQKFN